MLPRATLKILRKMKVGAGDPVNKLRKPRLRNRILHL
jgi:hypothetical protein